MACNSTIEQKLTKEKLAIEQKVVKFGAQVCCNMYVGYLFNLGYISAFSVQCHFCVIRCTCLKLHVTRKRLAVEENGVKVGIWGWGVVVIFIWSTFGHLLFTVI